MRSPPLIAVLPEPEWPDADRSAWQAAIRPAALFEAPGALAGRSQRRLHRIACGYGRWLAFCGTALAEVGSGLDLMTRARLTAYHDRLERRCAPYTVAGYMFTLWQAAEALAPPATTAELQLLRRLALNACRESRPLRDKRSRMVSALEVRALGFRLMREAKGCNTALEAARMHRDGLLIALLAALPLRRANVAALSPGQTLIRHDAEWHVRFAGDAMKNRRPFRAELPAEVGEAIEVHLAVHRPHLLQRRGRWHRGGTCHALFVSSHGSALRPGRITEIVCNRTAAAFGRPINPHLFRDIVATTIVEAAPAEVHLLGDVLGHADPRSLHKHYVQASGLAASRRMQAVIRGAAGQT